jgi:hypothetical protein
MILPLVSVVFLVVGLYVARSLKCVAKLKVVLLQHSGNSIVHLAARLLFARPLAWRSVTQAR